MIVWRYLLVVCLTISLGDFVKSACPNECLCPEKHIAYCRNITTEWPIFDKEIQELDVGTNKIKAISSESLKHLTKLKTLCLDYNAITELPDNLLSSLNLEVFSASHNGLKKLKFLEGQTNLKRIDLSYNKLEELPKEIFTNFKELIMLDLEGNNLKNPWPALQGLPLLSKLTLDGNPLQEMDGKHLVSLPKLKFLYVANCGLTKVDFSTGLPIFNLDLSGNPLKELQPETFSGLEYAFEVNLADSSLKNLPLDGFTGLKWLRRLSLENNPILALSKENFKNLPKLEALNLGNVNLKELDADLFSELPKLGNLTLAGNKLTNIKDGALSKVLKLYTLDLTNNQLSTFSHKTLAPNVKLVKLLLSGNPIKCTCEMSETAKWARDREITSEGECAVPDILAGKSWINAILGLKCLPPSLIEDLA